MFELLAGAPSCSRVTLAGVLAFLAAVGCAAAPPGPRGPLLGAGIQGAIDWSAAFSYAEAQRPGTAAASGTSDHYWTPFAIVPRRLELRLSPVEWVDLGTELGWLDGSLEARVGLPARPLSLWAGNLTFGFRSGEVGPFKDTKPSWSMWSRVEAYPLLTEEHARLVLVVGLDWGKFYHQVETDPDEDEVEDGLGFDAIQVMRREVRLETAVGYHYARRKTSVLIALEPYIVLDSDAPRADACGGCEAVEYRQSFGVVLVARLGLWKLFSDGRPSK